MAEGITATLVGWRNRRGQFAKASQAVKNAAWEIVRNARQPLLELARSASPVGQGRNEQGYVHFRDAWTTTYKQTPTGGELTLYNTSDHANFVLFPTKPHPITAHGQALRFEVQGEVMFRRSVMHPGTKGNDVFARIQPKFEEQARQQLDKAAATVMTGFRRTIA